MFTRPPSNYYGIPERIYREPKEIQEDIAAIKHRIDRINRCLNVREVLEGMISSYADACPERWVPALSEIAADAADSLNDLIELNKTVDMLMDELEETRCALMS